MSALMHEAVACVGSGTVGSAWSALFASCGLRVQVYDPSPQAEEILRRTATHAARRLQRSTSDLLDRITFTTDLDAALAGVSFVQESCPESLELKQALFADLDRRLPPSVLIASSTSELPMSAIQANCVHPGRTFVGHPINPPYAVELVEVVAGNRTAPDTMERACAFYAAVGRSPLRLDREAPGFVANRLQMALFREALQMVARGDATAAQIDHALMYGIGVRWAAVGVFGAYLLNLPSRDVEAWLDHFERFGFGAAIVHDGPLPEWTPELRAAVASGWQARVGASTDALADERDDVAIALARRRSRPGAAGLRSTERP